VQDSKVGGDAEPWGLRQTVRAFCAADPRTLGLFRVLFGAFLLLDLFRRLPDYVFFYTNEGMLPNHAALYLPMSGHLFSIYHAASTRGEVLLAFALTAAVYVAYLVGYRTRLVQVLTLVLVTSLHSRNIMLENGGDVVANILALWTCFLPLGRRFSLDALLEDRRRLRGQAPVPFPMEPDRAPIFSLAYGAIFVNLAVIYYFNTVHKDGFAWKAGTSVHYVLWADRLVQPLGVALRPVVSLGLVKLLTIGTLIMEASITILLLSPIWIRSCRRVAALMVIALHCGFQTVGHFGLFAFVMMLHAPLLLGPEDWEALARRMAARLPARTLYFDGRRALSRAVAAAASYLDHLHKIRLVDVAALPGSPVAERVAASGVAVARGAGSVGEAAEAGARELWQGAPALAQLLRALPFGVYPARLGELPGVRALLGSSWNYLSTQLGQAAAEQAATEPPLAVRPPLLGAWGPRGREALALLFIAALGSQVLVENRKVPRWLKPRQPEALAALAQYPRFFQGWSMFAPVPPMDDGHIVVDATTASGQHLDPLAGGLPVDFSLPGPAQGSVMTQFWYEFHDRIRRPQNERYRKYFHDWLAAWHHIERRPASDRIVAYQAYWVWRPTQPPGSMDRAETRRDRLMDWGQAPAPTPDHPAPLLITSPVRGF
jgi:hypothetical protein